MSYAVAYGVMLFVSESRENETRLRLVYDVKQQHENAPYHISYKQEGYDHDTMTISTLFS
jgi:hypothetical protein